MNEKKTVRFSLYEHWLEAHKYFPEKSVVCLMLQGSQNYGLETADSDVDTKLIVAPTFMDIAMNRKPVSTTHVRANNEHIDFKDLRLYMQTFRKQNLNFLEILFTPYGIVNPLYKKDWDRLVEAREEIAHYNQLRSVASMYGVASEKFHALEHEYPSKVEVLAKWGYDMKQLHHLLRIEEFTERYLRGESYADCLHPRNTEYLKAVKRGLYNLDVAREKANSSMANISKMYEEAKVRFKDAKPNKKVEELLDDVQYSMMLTAVKNELKGT